MKSVLVPRCFLAIFGFAVVFLLLSSHAQAETKEPKKIVRAVYQSGLVLHEEPAGTVLANPSVCLPKDEGAKAYDYPKRLADTVAKANTRMTAQVLEFKMAGFEKSISLLDRNIAFVTGTIDRLKSLPGAIAYLLPIGAEQTDQYQGAEFAGKCYKAPDAQMFGNPDALGDLKQKFDSGIMYLASSADQERGLKRELPDAVRRLATLDANTKLSKKEKEKLTAEIADEVMKKVEDFIGVDPVTAALVAPASFGSKGGLLATTPSVTLTETTGECKYDLILGIGLKAKVYNITVDAISASHTFQKCLPEKAAIAMMKDQLVAKKKLLQTARAKYAKELAGAGEKLDALQKAKPQYFGD